MQQIFAFFLTLIYAYTWVLYSKYQFIERDNKDAVVKADANKKWHNYKFYNQVSFFLVVYFAFGPMLAASLTLFYQLFFNSVLNVIALKKPVYYLGNNPIDLWLKNKFGEKMAYYVLAGATLLSLILSFIFPDLLNFIRLSV